jgi:uncharacterized protein (TIGR03067 family)
MAKSLLFLAAVVILPAALPSAPVVGQGKGGPAKGKNDLLLKGEWKLLKSYSVYTGGEKDALWIAGEHKLSIKDGTLEVSGYVKGAKTTVKYTLELDPSSKPKRFKQTNPANREDYESGIYWVNKDVLLMRTEKAGKAAPEFSLSGIQMNLKNAAGDDATIPDGFLLRRGARGRTLLEFIKVVPKT